ncbi:hypothetical protein AB986_12570 [Alkalihalobacillus macyae]|uniref:Lantibiotic biosynthesis protein n=2 Tax=Guptibacillus hwajinpoensis TaxID=208199 RepID=A0A0J6CWX3_9BACL|nr:hypothetical protein AB986_12570 [Alkalihalobacillus macyae]
MKGRIQDVVFNLAKKLNNPEEVERKVMAKDNKTLIGKVNPWGPLSLSHGFPGTIMFFGELDDLFPNQGWDEIAHKHIVYLTQYLQMGVHSISLFGGVTGLALSILNVSKNGERYQNLLFNLDTFIKREAENMLKLENERLEEQKGVTPAFYDVIQGGTGIGRYLLERAPQNPELYAPLKQFLKLFTYYQLEKDRNPLLGWHVIREDQFLEKDKVKYPEGNVNFGLAHGVLGPMNLLTLAASEGVEVPLQKETIESMSEDLFRVMRYDSDNHPVWPHRLAYKEMLSNDFVIQDTRNGWCYGNPGVARSLYLAGEVLGNQRYKQVAMNGFKGIVSQPNDDLVSASFCHGKSGLLQCLVRMRSETGEGWLDEQIWSLTDSILGQYDKENPLGFYDIEEFGGQGNTITKAGLLEGSSGTGLSLMGLLGNGTPRWDKAFLLS